MVPGNPTYVIYDRKEKGIMLYCRDTTGRKVKALFTNKQLANDAIANTSVKDNRDIKEFVVCTITGLEPAP